MIPFYGPGHAKSRVVYFLFRVALNSLLIAPPHSVDHVFHLGWSRTLVSSFRGGDMFVIFLLEGERVVLIRLSLFIMAFCIHFVFNFMLKQAHHSHSVKSSTTLIFPWSTFNISSSVTLECDELVLIFLSAINPETQHEARC